ncbi:Cof-type HAD-IIB family hydrolase [Rhodococcus erythropolis]|uniref:Cof-type HAD-IIB family hydrolase n=1 Tax=Rhodococcus erythropolis TaxID=1833 RepID=UPI0029496FEF|nr:Cof-type HAD-IIB family hydrolase [Rhodococcus erythropolis]MDV6272165.1 Cof-type HAD-IIB family hydrolase [Rhodococcus erythropolis]
MTRIRMFATDLDGTLLRSDRTISTRTAQAMENARLAGIEVVWATARARHSVHMLASSCGFRGKAVCANGAVILDLADGTPEIVDTVSIEMSLAATAMEQVRTLVPGVVFANVGPTQFYAEPEYAALCEFADHHRHLHEMVLADTLPLDVEPMVKIVARHAQVPSADLYRTAVAAGIEGVELTHSGAPYMEMAAAGVSKASALAQLCAIDGIDASEVAAAGDAFNDVAMLTWAGTALAPANARAEVIELADRILPTNDEDGVASYLEELVAGSWFSC